MALLLATLLSAAVGCDSGAAHRRALASANPLDRARGVIRVSQARDGRAVHKLVNLLEDSDPAVRMYAILALKRICGRDYGYRYYADVGERSTAVERWRQALRDGDVEAHPQAAYDDSPAEGHAGGGAPEQDPVGTITEGQQR